MNYRFFQSNRCLFFSFLFLYSCALHAQDTGPAPLDSLPNPDFGLQNRNGCPTISTVCPKAAWTLRSR